MFQLTGNDERALVLVPSTPFVLKGAPLEAVAMERIHGAPPAPPAPVATVRFQLMTTAAEPGSRSCPCTCQGAPARPSCSAAPT
jgi:hypothetical protein